MSERPKKLPTPDGPHLLENPLFTIGTLIDMDWGAEEIAKLVDRYGGLVYVPGVVSCLLVSDREASNDIYRMNVKHGVTRSGMQKAMESLVGKIVTADDPDYEERRRLIGEPLSQSAVEKYGAIIQNCTKEMLSTWHEKIANGEFNLTAEIGDLFTEIVPRTLVGGAELPKQLSADLDKLIQIGFDLGTQTNPLRKLSYEIYKDKVFSDLANFIKGARSENPEADFGILSTFLGKLPEKVAISEFFGVYGAALETTRNTIIWTLKLLAEDRQNGGKAYDKLRHESLEVYGQESTIPTYSARQLQYARQTFEEGLRLYPAAWRELRQTRKDIVVKGYRIPKNTWIFILPYLTQVDAQIWDDAPYDFKPERMADKKNFPVGAYQPFAAGIHACPGMPLALMEGSIILSMIAKEFPDIAKTVQGEVAPKYSATMVPPDRMPVTFS